MSLGKAPISIMNRLIFVFILSLAIVPFNLQSQEIVDSAIARASYDYSYKTSVEQEHFIKSDLTYLEIGKNITKSYSQYEHLRDSVTNEALKRNYSTSDLNNLRKGYRQGDKITYYQWYDKGKTVVAGKFLSLGFIYEEEMKVPKWVIHSDKRNIMGYDCQKATTDYLGRKWIVYFTLDIPINKGPWKLWGLPGLIIEAIDSQNIFRFRLNGFEKLKDTPIIFTTTRNNGEKFKTLSKKDFIKQEKLFYDDVFIFIRLVTGRELKREDGQPLPKSNRDFIPIEPC